MVRLKVVYAVLVMVAVVFGGVYAYLNLPSESREVQKEKIPQVGANVEPSARISLPADASGITVKRLTYWPDGFQKSGPRPLPGEKPTPLSVYLIQFDVNTSKIGAIEWIMIEGAGKSFNVTSPLGYLHKYTQYPKQNATIVQGAGVLFGELGKVDLWRGGEQVQVTFGLVTRDDIPISAATIRSGSFLKCKDAAEIANCVG